MGGNEKETDSKAGFLKKLTQGFGPSEEQRRAIKEAETRNLLAQYTPESLEVVEERLRQRYSPEIRLLLANKLSELKEASDSEEISDDELLSFYKTSIEVGSVMLFGEGHQVIDLDSPLVLADKDIKLVDQLKPVARSLQEGDESSALEKLRQIPEPFGSKCDRGEFDGYNHETLIVTATSAAILRNVLPNVRRDEIRAETTEGLLTIIRGFDAKERLTVARGFTGLFPPST